MEKRDKYWWDRYWVGMAKYVSTASKDPSTKVGVVLISKRNCVLGTGYNGFAKGIADTDERYNNRDAKYPLIVHAELNAILNCERRPEGATLYIWPGAHCCADCVKAIIQAGIVRVCGPHTEAFKRWGSGNGWLLEAGIEIDYLELEKTE
jgi:dCMP deaminase